MFIQPIYIDGSMVTDIHHNSPESEVGSLSRLEIRILGIMGKTTSDGW